MVINALMIIKEGAVFQSDQEWGLGVNNCGGKHYIVQSSKFSEKVMFC